jgi:hypothetical protein
MMMTIIYVITWLDVLLTQMRGVGWEMLFISSWNDWYVIISEYLLSRTDPHYGMVYDVCHLVRDGATNNTGQVDTLGSLGEIATAKTRK